MTDEFDEDVPAEVEDILRRQDEAMALLERLRAEEPFLPAKQAVGGGRRDFRRWPAPPGVTVEAHDGLRWHTLDCVDMGVGGARLAGLPDWAEGPMPARLRAPGVNAVLVLADVMWRDKKDNKAGVRFEFQDDEERDQWSGALIDALLARHALS